MQNLARVAHLEQTLPTGAAPGFLPLMAREPIRSGCAHIR